MSDTKSKERRNQKSWAINVGDMRLLMHSRFSKGRKRKTQIITSVDVNIILKEYIIFFSAQTLNIVMAHQDDG